MIIFWSIIGAILGGGLGWLYDRRFVKRDENDTQLQDEKAPT